MVSIRDGHADIFADADCGYPHYPTYVGYSAIYVARISDRQPNRICMAIPSQYPIYIKKYIISTCEEGFDSGNQGKCSQPLPSTRSQPPWCNLKKKNFS